MKKRIKEWTQFCDVYSVLLPKYLIIMLGVFNAPMLPNLNIHFLFSNLKSSYCQFIFRTSTGAMLFWITFNQSLTISKLISQCNIIMLLCFLNNINFAVLYFVQFVVQMSVMNIRFVD